MTGSGAVDEDYDDGHYHDDGCEGDEAAIPTGGVKPTFTERPVSFIHRPQFASKSCRQMSRS